MRSAKRVLLATAMLCTWPVSHGAAQDLPHPASDVAADNREPGDIVVTARKRDEDNVAVPASITVISGETLNALQYRQAADFLTLSPGVSLTSGSNGLNADIQIRGVGTPDSFVEPGNAVYIDDVYASGTRTFLPAFYDIQSVQVLKGPQAGLYGRNTTGGAVLITTGQPTKDFSVRAEANYGRYDRLDLNGTVNIPIAEILQLRVTGWHADTGGGYYRNTRLGVNLDASRDTGGRATLAFTPASYIKLTVTGELSDQKLSGFEGYVEGGRLGPTTADIETRTNILRDDQSGLDARVERYQAKLEIDTGHGAVTLIGGRRYFHASEAGDDFDGTAYAPSLAAFQASPVSFLFATAPTVSRLNARLLTDIVTGRTEGNRSTYAEARYATPDRWRDVSVLIGGSYYDDRSTFVQPITFVRDAAAILPQVDALPLPLPDLAGAFNRNFLQTTTSYSGFGELILRPTEKIEITGDIRYTHDTKSVDFTQRGTGIFTLFINDAALKSKRTFTNWSPGIVVSYRPSDAVNVYAKYVRGFRAGGFNTLVNTAAFIPYNPEVAENWEMGLKGRTPGGVFQYGISGFYLKIANALIPVLDQGSGLGPDTFPLRNVGKSTTYGIEAEARLRPTKGLSLTASLGIFSNEVKATAAQVNDEQPYVPSVTAALVANYERPLSSTVTGLFTAGWRHREGGITAETDFRQRLDGDNLVDLDAGLRFNNHFELHGYVRNALNDHYIISSDGLTTQQAIFNAFGGGPANARVVQRDIGAIYGVRASVRF